MFQDRGHLQGAFPDTCTAECKTIFEPFYVRKCLFELSHRSRTLLVRVPQSQAECEERIGAENSYQASSEDARSYANCKRRRAALLGFVQPLKKTCEQSSQSARARLAAVTEARHPPRTGHCSCLNQRHSSVEGGTQRCSTNRQRPTLHRFRAAATPRLRPLPQPPPPAPPPRQSPPP